VTFLERLRRRRREQRILKECGCICYCPKCREPLNDQAKCAPLYPGTYEYTCGCGHVSDWNFDAAPVPFLVKPHDAPALET